MNEYERIVCEFLRKIAPLREWEYIGEVEHYWIGELCNELNKQLKAENAKLRELVRRAHGCKTDDGCCEDCWCDYGECPIEAEMHELGIEVDE